MLDEQNSNDDGDIILPKLTHMSWYRSNPN